MRKAVLGVVVAMTTASVASAQTVDQSVVPTYVDNVQRGLRLRMDLWGREAFIGNPDPPVQLIVPDVVNEKNDTDIGGMVILGWDRPFGVPLVTDLMGDVTGDVGGDSPVSPFLDDSSVVPKAHIYSAFIGLSGAPGEALEPFKLNVGRMTEVSESPITYDGLSGGVKWKFPKLGFLNAKIWGGLDAPQHLAADPFSRIDAKQYQEAYADQSGFVSPTGGKEIVRSPLDFNADGTQDPNLNAVFGLNVEGRFAGVGFELVHTSMPAAGSIVTDAEGGVNQFLPLQRTKLGASYGGDSDALSWMVGADLKASDFLPRSTSLHGDVLTGDGTTRVGGNFTYQFLEDICAYDCSFRAFNPSQFIDQVPDQGAQLTNDQVEAARVHDQIRHLNIGPAEENVALVVDAERQLPAGFTALVRGRVRQHLDDKDLDYFRTNVYEAGAGVTWSTGLALELGTEVYGGAINSGNQNGAAYDLQAEGITSYLENRLYVRTVLLEGKLSNLSEVFVRREDIQTKALVASGQWSGSFASTIRYDIIDMWSVSARLDADALSPVDTLNGSGYLGALVATSLKF